MERRAEIPIEFALRFIIYNTLINAINLILICFRILFLSLAEFAEVAEIKFF